MLTREQYEQALGRKLTDREWTAIYSLAGTPDRDLYKGPATTAAQGTAATMQAGAQATKEVTLQSRAPGAEIGSRIMPDRAMPSKPLVKNPDGSYSSEQTITVEQDGKHYIVPTIYNGKKVSDEEAIQGGQNVGVYDSAEEAERVAKERSASFTASRQDEMIPKQKGESAGTKRGDSTRAEDAGEAFMAAVAKWAKKKQF
jgi:hypothetical protein